jgi:hypothetical protein
VGFQKEACRHAPVESLIAVMAAKFNSIASGLFSFCFSNRRNGLMISQPIRPKRRQAAEYD